jgi:hypothetical protein
MRKRLAQLRTRVPRVLWKYCGTRAVPIIETLRLKATRPNEFNDPFELSPGAFGTLKIGDLERLYADPQWVARWQPPQLPEEPEERREVLAMGVEVLQDTAKEIMAGELDRISATHAVICLSADPDSILMWSHYSENHAGFVVGIAHRRLGDVPLFPVQYSGSRVLYKATTPLKLRPNVRAIDMFLRKAAQWSYEREFRSIWPLTELIPGKIGNVAAFFLPLSPDAIVEVRLGCRASTALEEEIKRVLRYIGSSAPLFRARMHPRQYRLQFMPL